jgi:hypothetical protein
MSDQYRILPDCLKKENAILGVASRIYENKMTVKFKWGAITLLYGF